MYSQSLFPGAADISVPDNYDGTAFSESSMHIESKIPKIEPVKNETKFSPKDEDSECASAYSNDECEECSAERGRGRGGIFGIDFSGMLGNLFSGTKFSSFIPKDFGAEEILIIGIALFLLFSPERDIECALLLLALIFIK